MGASIFGHGLWWVFMAVSDSGGRGTDLVFENFNCGEVGGSDEGDFVLEDLNGGDGWEGKFSLGDFLAYFLF